MATSTLLIGIRSSFARTKFNDKPDAILIDNHARDLWIDHCSLSMAGDKLIAVGGGATDVTVSWCRFEDQEQVFQVGNQATQQADAVVSPAAAEEFCQAAASGDKTLRLYPGLYHDLPREPEKDEIHTEITRRILARC